MKTRILNLAVLSALVILLAAMLSAQMPIRQPLFRVDVPFAFIVGGVNLPPGQYHVYHPGDPYLVVIEKDDGLARAMVYVHPAAVADTNAAGTKLLFNKYGEQYFLSQVWTEPDREIHKCFRCRAEQTLMAQAGKPESVVVVAKR